MIIKYDAEGNVLWGVKVGNINHEHINAIAETSDGGIVVGGEFYGMTDLDNGQELVGRGGLDGMIIKYDAEGNVLWGAKVGGSASDYINTIAETRDGGIVVGGYFDSSRINLGRGQVLENKR